MQIIATAERHVDAPPGRVYGILRDFREHHPRILPPQFTDFEVECGGVGAGTVHRFNLTLAGRTSSYRVRVGEPHPGRMLIELDPARRMLTTFTVEPAIGGGTNVRIHTRWYTDGVRGLVERMVVPFLLVRVYHEELRLLDRYARDEIPEAVARPHGMPWASAR